MSAFDRIRQYEADVGYGIDAAGRPVYNASSYPSPRETAGMQSVHERMKLEAEKEELARGDKMSAVIRELINQIRRQNMPGTVQVPVYPLAAGGNQTYYNNER